MLTSWVSGALKKLFSIQADTRHWAAVKTLMEESLGTIKVDIPVEGGAVRAFFEKQTLVGDEDRLRKLRYKHTLISLDMDEPIGAGRNRDAAIVDLWEKVTCLAAGETILRFEQYLGNGEPRAAYTRFTFRNGVFVNQGTTTNEHPPVRSEKIETFLAEEKRDRMAPIAETRVLDAGRT